MHLLRNLFYIAARHNFTVSAQHLPGKQNVIADSLSRFNMQAFPPLSALRADMTRYLQEALAMSTRATYTSAHHSFIHLAITTA